MEEHGEHRELVARRAPVPGRAAPAPRPARAFVAGAFLSGTLALSSATLSLGAAALAPVSAPAAITGGGFALLAGHAFAAGETRVAGPSRLDAGRLEAAGLEEPARLMIDAAFVRAAEERAAIAAGAGADPSADPRDVARAHRRVRDALLDTVGVYNYVAGRHAGFAPNRLSVAEAPAGGVAAQAGLRAGDVLVAVDGWRVFDLDDLALLDAGDAVHGSARGRPSGGDATGSAAADERGTGSGTQAAGAADRKRVLELLRRGKPLTLTVFVPPDRLALRSESVAPADWAD